MGAKRSRRCFISDLNPIPGRADKTAYNINRFDYGTNADGESKSRACDPALLFMPVTLSRVLLANAILAKLHIHRLSVSDNLYLPGAPPPKRFEPVAYLIRLEFG